MCTVSSFHKRLTVYLSKFLEKRIIVINNKVKYYTHTPPFSNKNTFRKGWNFQHYYFRFCFRPNFPSCLLTDLNIFNTFNVYIISDWKTREILISAKDYRIIISLRILKQCYQTCRHWHFFRVDHSAYNDSFIKSCANISVMGVSITCFH